MRIIHPGSPIFPRGAQVAYRKKIQKPFITNLNQIYIRNLPKWTEKISSTGAPHVRLWISYGDETSRLVEQRSTLSRPGSLRRRYDHQTQRTVFVPARPNKRSREEIAEIDAELLRRANRLGGGYHLEIPREEEETEEM